jgi:ferredoxin
VTTKLCYFTGTGNTLWVGKKLRDLLPDADLVPLVQLARQDEIVLDAQRVGFLFPLYYLGLPEIVYRVISKADLSNCDYVFGLTTSGALPFLVTGGAQVMQEALRAGKRALDAFYYAWLPYNYLVGHEAMPTLMIKVQLALALRRIARIARWVEAQAIHVERGNRLMAATAERAYAGWMDQLAEIDRPYRVEPTCNRCGICEKICPVDNIALENGKPAWLGHCQQCLACIQFCPQRAIQYGDETHGRERYRHPEIRVREIMDQKEGNQ